MRQHSWSHNTAGEVQPITLSIQILIPTVTLRAKVRAKRQSQEQFETVFGVHEYYTNNLTVAFYILLRSAVVHTQTGAKWRLVLAGAAKQTNKKTESLFFSNSNRPVVTYQLHHQSSYK